MSRRSDSIAVQAEQVAPLSQARRLANESTLAEFAVVWPVPALLIYPFCEYSTAQIQTVQGGGPAPSGMTVAALKKRAGANAFANMITIGRARNNDIEVRASDVSKFHAYLSRAEGSDGWLICDAGSSFGTSMDGAKLEPRKAVPIPPGAELRMGSVLMSFFDPAGLHGFLRGEGAPPRS